MDDLPVEWQRVVIRAADTWTNINTPFWFSIGHYDDRARPINAIDEEEKPLGIKLGIGEVRIVPSTLIPKLSRESVPAYSWPYHESYDSSKAITVLVVINTDYDWSVGEIPSKGQLDLQSVVIHELGHVAGLTDNLSPSSVMLFLETTELTGWLGFLRRDISDDDVDNLASLYCCISPIPRPETPVLTSLLNGAITNVLRPTLDWADSEGADRYFVQISRNEAFTKGFVVNTSVSSSRFTPETNLTPDVTYHWRIKAQNVAGNSTWSPIWSFTIAIPSEPPPKRLECTTTTSFEQIVEESISSPGQQHIYCFTSAAGQGASIRMHSASEGKPDAYLELYDPSNKVIASNNDYWQTDSFLTTTLPLSGTYKIVASGYASTTGTFRLRLESGRKAGVFDINRDCVVDEADWKLLTEPGVYGSDNPDADFSLNGVVDSFDVSQLFGVLQSGEKYTCPTITPIKAKQTKVIANDGEQADAFGASVAISGDYAIVGAPGDSDSGFNSGSAYIFMRNGDNWTQQTKLIASDGREGDFFGIRVSISGDYAIVGAPDNYPGSEVGGSAYIFRRDGNIWTQQAKLTASDSATRDGFGASVAVNGDYAIVGATAGIDYLGAAYIFVRNGTIWTQQAKLTASDGITGDFFGETVAISGDHVIVGASGDNDKGFSSGSAYIFVRNQSGWTQQTKLIARDGREEDRFGHSVAISGDYAIVGAPGADVNDLESGSAYIFMRNGDNWTQQTKLIASDGAYHDLLGKSVAISGDYAIVGAYQDCYGCSSSTGKAYIFISQGNNWTQQAKLTASDGADEDYFGQSVALSGDYTIIGAPGDDDRGTSSGAAYVFKKP